MCVDEMLLYDSKIVICQPINQLNLIYLFLKNMPTFPRISFDIISFEFFLKEILILTDEFSCFSNFKLMSSLFPAPHPCPFSYSTGPLLLRYSAQYRIFKGG